MNGMNHLDDGKNNDCMGNDKSRGIKIIMSLIVKQFGILEIFKKRIVVKGGVIDALLDSVY